MHGRKREEAVKTEDELRVIASKIAKYNGSKTLIMQYVSTVLHCREKSSWWWWSEGRETDWSCWSLFVGWCVDIYISVEWAEFVPDNVLLWACVSLIMVIFSVVVADVLRNVTSIVDCVIVILCGIRLHHQYFMMIITACIRCVRFKSLCNDVNIIRD